MGIEVLSDLRDRVVPMLEIAAERYQGRVPAGYPVVVDAVEQGIVGLELDPSHALYFTLDGGQPVVEVYRRSPRTDSRSSASRQKHAGVPLHDRRPIAADITDLALRNLVNELMLAWNTQPGIIHISDS